MDVTNFTALCDTLNQKVNYKVAGPPKIPFTKLTDLAPIKTVLNRAIPNLPLAYQQQYAKPVLDNLAAGVRTVMNDIQSQNPNDSDAKLLKKQITGLEPFLGAIYDRNVDEIRPQLNRFQAVVSDLYRSFLDANKRTNAGVNLAQLLPALVTFANAADDGPFTITTEQVTQTFDSKIGVVSLPSSYRNHPLLWASLCHEVGGHDVLHADNGLLDELSALVADHFSNDQNQATLWTAWIDEAASDVYGLLNIGPTFAVNLSSFLTTLISQSQPGTAAAIPILRSDIPLNGNSLLDPHPTDLLRIHLALGAVEQLHGLSVSQRTSYIEALTNLAETCAGGLTGITLTDFSTRPPTPRGELPLADMQDAARQVGGLIADSKLNTLNGHSIQDIETWDSSDESIAVLIQTALATDKSIAGLGDDAQVLAGATLALLDNPTPAQYDIVTRRINEALDASFDADPVFGSTLPHHSVFIAKIGATGTPRRARGVCLTCPN
ncbi:MAG: hypothetical protein JWM11_461 [Planctomycetaceae bacterium]|nr:hypothetical protein [Planctomycetaceae bacterium]